MTATYAPVSAARQAPSGDKPVHALRRMGSSLATVIACLAILVVSWQLAVSMLHVNGFIAKKPADVYDYFLKTGRDGTSPREHWRLMWSMLEVTLGHAALGFTLGVVGSVGLAILFKLIRPLEVMFLPIALVLRTVPLLAMAPAIYLIFGKSGLTAAIICSVDVFFPILVNIAVGFRAVSAQSVDLVRVNGGTRWTIICKVALPTAVPNLLASMRIAIPGAVTGAMLYEWLFTFDGLGAGITAAKANSDYAEIWAIVVLVTTVSIFLYMVATLVESVLLDRWSGR